MAYKISSLVNKRIQAYVDVLKKDIPITGVYLFGSHAKGLARLDSDIDLAIVSTKFGKDSHEDGKWLYRKLWDVSYSNFDVVGYSPKEFKNGYSPLLAEIKKTGILVK
jgi:predicted nucleotidyltransferase